MDAIDELGGVPAKVKPEEVKLARQVMSTFEGEVDFKSYRDEYQDGLRQIIDAKIEGREVVAPEVEAPPKVVNLMEALRKSLDSISASKKKPQHVEARPEARAKEASARLNEESPNVNADRRIAGSLAPLSAWLLLLVFVILCGVDVSILRAQTSSPANSSAKLKLDTGKDVYQAACVSCHGVEGKGAQRTAVGFDTRLPDFSDCSFATKEPDGDWSATIHNGGPARGFSRIMPAFRDVLDEDQIDKVIGYLRAFCTSKSWPQGDLNFPRAFITEKAFPENEVVLTSSFNTSRTSGMGTTLVLERRVGSSGQIEAALPYMYTKEAAADSWMHGFGDASIGYKHKVYHSNEAGSIMSVAARNHRADRRYLEGNWRRDAGVRNFRGVRSGAAGQRVRPVPDGLRTTVPHKRRAERVVCAHGNRPELQRRRRIGPHLDADARGDRRPRSRKRGEDELGHRAAGADSAQQADAHPRQRGSPDAGEQHRRTRDAIPVLPAVGLR